MEGKIHTKVKIGHISLGLPKLVVLENVYFEDQKKDTLIAGDKLKVDISLLKLLNHQVEVNEIDLEGITANVGRGADNVFNFDYITKAFAGPQNQPAKPADTTSAMKISIGKLVFDRIHISYKDVITGYNVKFLLGHFDTRITRFDMDKMKFTIPKITLSGFDAKIIQTPAAAVPAPVIKASTPAKPMNMDLGLGTIDISKIKVDYKSAEMAAKVNLGNFLVEMDKIDLKNQKVGIKSVELGGTSASLVLAKAALVTNTAQTTGTPAPVAPAAKGWGATIGKVSFTNDDIKFDNDAQKPLAKGLDFGHIDIRNLNADAENISYSPDTISGGINSFTFSDKSGLVIKEFHTKFFYGPKNSYLNDLYLETPQTVIQKQLQVSYPSISSLSKNLGQLFINANLDGSRLGLKDVALLMPSMAGMEPFKHSPNAVFRVNGRLNGKVNNLRIPSLEISGLSNTHIKASAVMRGLPDVKKSYFDITIDDLTTGRADIDKLVSAGIIPSSVSVPANLNLKGNFKGSISDFSTKMTLRSTYGAVDFAANMKNGSSKGHEIYSANIKANNLNVGALIKQPQNVGTITLTTTIKGTGLDPKKASLQFNGDVAKAYVKGYTYQHLALGGTSHSGNYTAIARMKDPNISFSLNGKADMTKKYPAVSATLLLDSINLKNLNLSKTDMRVHGKLVADVQTASPDYLNANIQVTDLLVAQPDKVIKIDSVSLVSTANADSSTIKLKAPMLYAHVAGKYKLTEMATALQDVTNKYFNIAGTADEAPVSTAVHYAPEQFSFDMRIVKTPLTAQLLPALKTLDPVLITGHFNSQTGDLVINGSAPKMVYGTNIANNVKLALNTANNALNYSLTADEIKAGSSINLLNTSVTGNAQNNKLNISLQVRDAVKKERYRIAGVFNVLPGEYQFSFLQNGLILDYTQWAVNADNALQFGGKGLLAKDFSITNNDQVLSINSDTQEMNAPITVDFKNFHIETLTRAAQQDSLQVGGVINGNAHLSNLQKSMVFTAALNVGDFSFKGDTVGNIAIKVNNQTQNAYSADVAISGKGNQVNLTGTYNTAPTSSFDLNLNIVSLNMKSIEGFSFGSLKNASGNISGQLKITGTPSAPVVRGDVNFNKVAFNVAMLNSYFSMPKETITFNNDGILFDDFTLIDSLGNKAIVTGTLYTKTFTDFKFGIDINTNNFRVINSTQADNKLYYGKLYLDSQIKIRGDMDKPVVDATLTVNDKTDLTIVLPEDDPGVEDRKGVVEFINPNAPKLDSVFMAKRLDSLRKSSVKGLDVSATLKVNKAAKFTVIVDENSGDAVQIQGDAQLNAAIDPSGKINLTGQYIISNGSYNLSYATVKRKFIFKSGSTITWNGDPTTATIDVTAIYVANVPPIDLVQDQVSGSSATTQTQYKQKLPFNVDLILKNELLKPSITFNIDLPDSSTYSVSPDVVSTIDARLDQVRQDTNEMNKQVLGVLILGHFIGDNPLQSQGGSTGVNGAIRSSVSSLLSDQLNKLAGNLIAGVQLSFDLTSGEDYSSGVAQNRTDLNVGLSKQFLNDRITVTVGNNFNLEGQNQPGQKTTNIAGNLSVNYKITQDGRYMVRAYRRDEYIVIEGEIVETGVGFTITYEYNKFKELFAKKSPEEKARERKYKLEQKEKKKGAELKGDSTSTQVNQGQTKNTN